MDKRTESKCMTRSPYGVFEGEECALTNVEKHITEDELCYLMRNKFVGPLEVQIVQIICKFHLLNIKQISDMLEVWAEKYPRELIESSLTKMYNKEFLDRMVIYRRNAQTLRYVYMLGKYARMAVEGAEFSYDMSGLSICDVKTILATNQLVISALSENAISSFILYGIKECGVGRLVYNAQFSFGGIIHYVVVLRRAPCRHINLDGLLKLMREIEEAEKCRFIIVCEDMAQADEVDSAMHDYDFIEVMFDRELHYCGFTECFKKLRL